MRILAAGNYNRPLFAFLVVLIGLNSAAAQRAAHGRFAFRQTPHSARFRQPSPFTSLLIPFLGDSFGLDDIYSAGYPVAAQPPVILLQAAPAASGSDYPPPTEPSASTEPLMIELQNGRYVRVSNTAADEDLPLAPHPKAPPAKLTRSRSDQVTAQPLPHDLPPAVLVFRDGHSEEVHDYTIADGVLYTRGDFYTDGYWNKKIELSALDITQTLAANAARDVKFVLPSSPNEVVTRP